MTTAGLRELNTRLGARGRSALLLLIVAIVVLLVSVKGLGKALLAPSAKEVKSLQDEKIKQLAGEYSKSLEQQAAQFTGRSVFFIPSAPVPPPPPPPPEVKKDDSPPPPPPPPATYGGPKIIAMINGVAWFDDGQRLEAGQEGKDGLKLTGIKAPWDAAVTWKGVDFTISLFDRDKVVYPPAKEAPKGETPKAAEPQPADPAAAPEAKPEPKPETQPEPTPAEPKPAEPPTPGPTGSPSAPPASSQPETPKPADPSEGNE